MGRTLEDGHRHEVDWSDVESTMRCTARVREPRPMDSTGGPDALVQHVGITDDRCAGAEHVASPRPRREWRQMCIGAPYTLVGTLDQLVDEIMQHYERWGFTSYVVRAGVIDAATALIERLRSN